MNQTEIYIGDSLLDLSPGTVVAHTLKSNDIGDLKTRNSNYTNQFKVPFTENNDRIYENAKNHQSDTLVPYQKQNAKVTQDGIDIIGNGIHVLKRSYNGYEMYILSGSAQFFDVIQGKLMSDLDTSSLDDVFDPESFRNTTSGVIAPVMDYGNYNGSTNDIHKNTYLPSFYYFTLIDLIFTQAGYGKSGSIFSNTKYLKRIVPYSRKEFSYPSDFINSRNVVASRTTSQVMGSVSSPVTLIFPTVSKSDDFGYFNSVTGIYTPTQSGASTNDILFYTRITLVVDITVTGGNVNVYSDDTSAFGDLCVFLQDKGTGTYSRSTDFADGTIANPFGARQGGFIKIEIGQFNLTPASVTVNSASLIIECIGKPGTYLYYNNFMPEISQKDFIKDFLITYGQLIKEENGVIYLKGIDEIINDRSNAKDWTLKRASDLKDDDITFLPDNYAQNNYFEYSIKTEEGISSEFAKGAIEISNLNLEESKTIYKSPFNASDTKQVGGVFMLSIPIFDTSTTITIFDNEPGLRFALVRDKYSYEPNVIYSSGQSSYKVAYFEDPLQSDTMAFSQFLTSHYFYFTLALQKAKKIKRIYNLSASDIATMDFFLPIFDEDSYYLIDTVGPFVSGKVTEVTLLKI